ncbi:GspH/FimT family pseudopilin [Dyella amyloliquefaciens]|uniref:GspH/FimT family pseudopilin n=1 Tax=Dyella amyloliquefaciens TaxID=1770545 RepID=UPI00102E9D58|nr:GspH/FimT family pseudopilin [Dyella amyloliquefaciens]
MRVPSQSRSIPSTGMPCRVRGFTMVELMITLAVAAILTMIAVPSFSNMINANRLTTATNAMVGALNSARMEAIKRNGSVQFCSNVAATNTAGASDALGNACATNAGAVLALTGTTVTQVLAAPSALSIPSIQVRGTMAAIRYNGTGLGYAPGSTTPFGTGANGSTVVELCSTALSSNNDIQIDMATGSIITSSPPSTVTCP